jgi:hypothetical protein
MRLADEIAELQGKRGGKRGSPVAPPRLDPTIVRRRSEKESPLTMPGGVPRPRRGVVHKDKISWPTRGPNVELTIG